MPDTTISILDGSTFMTSSRAGDIDAAPDQLHGLFYKDMRHLSRWLLSVNGRPPDVPTTEAVEYYFAPVLPRAADRHHLQEPVPVRDPVPVHRRGLP